MTLNFSIRISPNRVSLSLKTLLIIVQITKAFQTLQVALRASEERKTIQIHSPRLPAGPGGPFGPYMETKKDGVKSQNNLYKCYSFLQMDYFHVY